MTTGQTEPQEQTDISVLREMVRLAENRRTELWTMIERMNQYNLGIVAFSGSFLSLLITIEAADFIFYSSGFFTLCAMGLSLWTIRPQILKGATLLIGEDVETLRKGQKISLTEFLLLTADLTEKAANAAGKRADTKKKCTIISASFLAISLVLSYILYAYA